MEFVMYQPTPSSHSRHNVPAHSPNWHESARPVSTYGHLDHGAPRSPSTRTTFPGPECSYQPSTRFERGHFRGTGVPERPSGLTGPTSSGSPENEGVDGLVDKNELLDKDDLPSLEEIFRPQLGCSQPELIDLTLDSSDEESVPSSPTGRSSASISPRISATRRSTSSVSSPAVSETPTPEPGLCVPALPPVHPTKHLSTPSRTPWAIVPDSCSVQPAVLGASSRPEKRSPFKNRPAWAPPLYKEVNTPGAMHFGNVGDTVKGGAGEKSTVSLSAQQNMSGSIASPSGTHKRKSSTLDRPALAEGFFTFDVFGEDDTTDIDRSGSRPAKRPARVASPQSQFEDNPPATASQSAMQDGSDKGLAAWPGSGEAVEVRSGVGQDLVSLLDGGWQVDRIVREAESGSGFEVVVTKAVWLAKADLDPKLLRSFRAEQRRAAPGVPTRRSARLRGQAGSIEE